MPTEDHYFAVMTTDMPNVPVPRTTSLLADDDPYVYLDAEDCLIWVAGGCPHYMNDNGETATVPSEVDIVKRLGKFAGIAIQPI